MKKTGPISMGTIYAIAIAVFITGGFFYIQDRKEILSGMEEIKNEINSIRSDSNVLRLKNEQSIATLTQDLDTLKQANKELFASSEKIRSDAEKKITALQSEVTSTQSGLDLSAVIKDWRPYIAKVKCSWFGAKESFVGTGSGLLFKTNSKPYAHLVTNKHVITYKENKVQECTITFPDTKDVIDVADNSVSLSAKGYDFGIIDVASQSAYVDALANQASSRNVCLSATVGEKVVILGYPSIGTKDDITATEGIIAGVDGDYYITSAKVEYGNSGGAAIIVRNGGKSCYLGIPTFTNVGRVESLARILSAKVLQ